jgi:hypothetical protein
MDGCLCPFMFGVRYVCSCPKNTQVLFIGDSGIDFWENTEGHCCSSKSSQWREFSDASSSVRMQSSAMGCSGLPAYQLCCIAPFVFYRVKPIHIVTMMGSNDFIWAPFPCFHTCCPGAVVWYLKRFVAQVPKETTVIFIPDFAYDMHVPLLRIGTYSRLVRNKLAGTIVTPKLESTLDNPVWTYVRTTNDARGSFPNLVYLDWEPFIEQIGLSEAKKRLVRGGIDAGEPSALFYSACANKWVMAELTRESGTGIPSQARMTAND